MHLQAMDTSELFYKIFYVLQKYGTGSDFKAWESEWVHESRRVKTAKVHLQPLCFFHLGRSTEKLTFFVAQAGSKVYV